MHTIHHCVVFHCVHVLSVNQQGRSQEFHLGGINFNFANFAKVHTGTISNLSWVKEKKTTSNHIKICKVADFGGYIDRYTPLSLRPC